MSRDCNVDCGRMTDVCMRNDRLEGKMVHDCSKRFQLVLLQQDQSSFCQPRADAITGMLPELFGYGESIPVKKQDLQGYNVR